MNGPLTQEEWLALCADGIRPRHQYDTGEQHRGGLSLCQLKRRNGVYLRDEAGAGVPLHELPFLEPGQQPGRGQAFHFPCPGWRSWQSCGMYGQGYYSKVGLVRLPCSACMDAGMRVQITDELLQGIFAGLLQPAPVDVQETPVQLTDAQLAERMGVPSRYTPYSLATGVRLVKGPDGRPAPLPCGKPKQPARDVIYVLDHGMEAAIKHLRTWGNDGASTLIYGGVGNGKTTVAYAWALDLRRAGRGYPVVLNEKALRAPLQSGYDSAPYKEARETLRQAARAGVLIWDDLAFSPSGDGPLPDRLLVEFTTLISERYDNKRTTLFTTNTSREGLEHRLGPSLFRRVWAMAEHRFEFTGGVWEL